ncbi:hypothetical protein UVI_02029310 [Ustilaginoidea virens]|uniref:Uncharacterized protein n=1 Tax=Ustilaginoidea virens TaxID=1159556 RepID=A0A1B5KYQ7_USTVR|nr:hypothetical protein UVI_02029310 [Ustilaginoidea virens]
MVAQSRGGEIDGVAVSQQASGEQLVVDVGGCCTQTVGVDHGGYRGRVRLVRLPSVAGWVRRGLE